MVRPPASTSPQDVESELTIQQLEDLHTAACDPVSPALAPCHVLAAALAHLATGAQEQAPPQQRDSDDVLRRKRALRPPSLTREQRPPSLTREQQGGKEEEKGEKEEEKGGKGGDGVPTNALDALATRLSTTDVDTGQDGSMGSAADAAPRLLTRCLLCGEDVGGLQDDVQRLAHLHLCLASSAWHLLQVVDCVLLVDIDRTLIAH